MGKITVVIPNYNGIAYIEACLRSLAKQTIEKFHTIVIDNGSTDGSDCVVKVQFPKVQLFRFEENRGFSAAVNKGIELSNSKYVLLLNNDTTVETDFLEKMQDAISKSDNIFSVSAKMIQMDDRTKLDGAGDLYCALGWAYARNKGASSNDAREWSPIFSACAGAAIYRKSIVEKIGLFDEHHFAYLEDLDIGYRAKIYGYLNYYTPDAIVYHVGSAVSGSRYNDFKVALASKNSVYVIYKNMPLLQILLNLPLLLLGFFIKTIFFIIKGYGSTYVKGLGRGIAFSMTKEARKNKVKFQFSHLSYYLRIQVELWYNIVARLFL
ncbi:MAG: glycosyltransferase family 2 protein [Eubacteriales bacterium]